MDRRTLLQGSAALAGTGALARLTLGQGATLNDHAAIPRTNWSKNFHFHTDRVYAPTTLEEVQQIVRANPKLKGLGSRHSFNDSADSHSAQISMRAVKSVSIDAAAKTATVGGGCCIR